jgi:hypothetical protein
VGRVDDGDLQVCYDPWALVMTEETHFRTDSLKLFIRSERKLGRTVWIFLET